jgi:hypothetical protein
MGPKTSFWNFRGKKITTCELFLKLHGANKIDFLGRIVIKNGTMLLYHDFTTKKESVEWRRPDENLQERLEVAASKKKLCLQFFGTVLETCHSISKNEIPL